MSGHPSNPDQLAARALGVCWHPPTSDRWPCQSVREAIAFIAQVCELWDSIPSDVKAVLTAEAVVDDSARSRAKTLTDLADRLYGARPEAGQ